MTSSYTSLVYHIVFSTKYRKPDLDRRDPIGDLHAILVGLSPTREARCLEIGGVDDHITL